MSQTSSKTLWSRSDKALIVVSAIVVALGVIFVTAIKRQNELPPIVVPSPKMPSPNAFDFFTRAGAAIVDRTKIGYAISSTHLHYEPEDHPYTQLEKEALLSENASTLKTLRQGFAYPYINPPARSFSALFPYYAKDRDMARLLALESQARAGRGDWSGAVGSNLDAIQFGTMVPHGSVLIGSLVGIACEAIGSRSIWRNEKHLDAAQSRAAARRLEHIASQQVPFADMVQEEEWTGQASLLEILRKPDWSHEFASVMSSSGSLPNQMLEIRMKLMPKRVILDDYTKYMDKAIASTRMPDSTSPLPPLPNDPVISTIAPNLLDGRFKSLDSRIQNALLMTSLALQAYRLEHGTYPASLADLSPKYLKTIPADPFARSGSVRYRLNGSGYVLYSVGPDSKDDGGTAILDTSKSAPTQPGASDQRRYIEQDSKGDIVAGVNIY